MATATQDGPPWVAAISAAKVNSTLTAVPTPSMSRQSTVRSGTSPRQRLAKKPCDAVMAAPW
jgi:hypothetical protein